MSIVVLILLIAIVGSFVNGLPLTVPIEFSANLELKVTAPSIPPRVFSGLFYQSTFYKSTLFDVQDSQVIMLSRYDAVTAFTYPYSQKSCTSGPPQLGFEPFNFLLSPGTVYNGSDVVDGVKCDWYRQIIGKTNPDGFSVCIAPYLDHNVYPVRYEIKEGDFFLQKNFRNFTSVQDFPPGTFNIPDQCNFHGSTDVPYGLVDLFETGSVGPFWHPPSTFTYVNTSITVQSDIVRSGKFAAKITVHPGDCSMNGGFGKFTERDELTTPMYMIGGDTSFFGFSMFLPSDFEITDNRLVLAQWKSNDLNAQSPVVALRFRSGEFFITVRNLTLFLPDNDDVKYYLPSVKLGVWNDFVFSLYFSDNDLCTQGFVKVWHNGTLVAEYDGKTSITCLPTSAIEYHMGLYRDAWDNPWTVFIDNFSIGKNYSDVDPARFDN